MFVFAGLSTVDGFYASRKAGTIKRRSSTHYDYIGFPPRPQPSVMSHVTPSHSSIREGETEAPVLLHISFHSQGENDIFTYEEDLRNWLKRFPFAAVLPVQPMTWQPTPCGLDLAFRRKKTDDKSGKDGGLFFEVKRSETDANALTFEAKRDSGGQFVAKSFSEMKLLVEISEQLMAHSQSIGLSATELVSFYGWKGT